MTPCITVYRLWHPVSQYTDPGHGTLFCNIIQIQVMTPCITVNRHREWHPVSQYTDTWHDTLPCHSIQGMAPCITVYTQGMAPCITVYRPRAWHPTLSQYTYKSHDTLYHSIQTKGMAPYPVTVYIYKS